ncbi:MAG: PDZ domain-containing protein [Candidatus Aureabacteria bacterium]|nr:PDZ domain-containing protein [Candidatus Auribacterota bacterium]
MRCRKVEWLLSDYIDGILGPTTKGSVEKHLAACQNCASALRRLGRTEVLVKNTPMGQPSESYWKEFYPRLMERLKREEGARGSRRVRFRELFPVRRPAVIVTSAAAALVLAASVFLMREKPERRETTARVSDVPARELPYSIMAIASRQPQDFEAGRLAGMPAGSDAPFQMVKEMHPLVIESVELSRGWLGVGVQELTPLLQAEFGIADGQGVVVAMVVESGPAHSAGIKEGDVIRSFGGKPVKSPQELIALVAQKAVGEKVALSIVREGREKTIEVAIGARTEKERGREAGLGLILEEVTPQLAARFNLSAQSRGLLVTDVHPGGAAARAGMRRGDIVLDVNRRPVTGLADWEARVRDAKPGQKFLVRTQRGFFVIKAE